MTTSIAAWGTTLGASQMIAGSGYLAIAEVRDMDGPALKMETVDVTSHSSASGWAEHIGTTLEAGELSLEIGYVPSASSHSSASGLIRFLTGKTARPFQIGFPDGTAWEFSGLVTAFKPKAAVKGDLVADVSIQVTGAPTLSASWAGPA